MKETHYTYEPYSNYALENTKYEYSEEFIRSKISNITEALCEEKDSKAIGALGETYASFKLMQKGWILLNRNWHSRFGELDIVMLTPDKILVFIEVKTRRSTRCGIPLEAITYKKRLKTRKTAMKWLQENGSQVRHYSTRFDAISITIPSITIPSKNTNSDTQFSNEESIQFKHIQGAF